MHGNFGKSRYSRVTYLDHYTHHAHFYDKYLRLFFNSENFRSKFIFAPFETLHRIMQYMKRLKREKQQFYFAKTKFKNNFSTEKKFAEFIKLFSKFYNLASRNMNLSEHKFSFHDNKEVLMISRIQCNTLMSIHGILTTMRNYTIYLFSSNIFLWICKLLVNQRNILFERSVALRVQPLGNQGNDEEARLCSFIQLGSRKIGRVRSKCEILFATWHAPADRLLARN